jgi:hypothetical protein
MRCGSRTASWIWIASISSTRGDAALNRDDPAEAAARLGEALELWRGPALADVAYESFAQPEIARLEERRLAAMEERIDADLALGRHAEVIAELEGLVAEHPEREHLCGQLMLALYRSGRQSEALEAYHDARRALSDELGGGTEPGPARAAVGDPAPGSRPRPGSGEVAARAAACSARAGPARGRRRLLGRGRGGCRAPVEWG